MRDLELLQQKATADIGAKRMRYESLTTTVMPTITDTLPIPEICMIRDRGSDVADVTFAMVQLTRAVEWFTIETVTLSYKAKLVIENTAAVSLAVPMPGYTLLSVRVELPTTNAMLLAIDSL